MANDETVVRIFHELLLETNAADRGAAVEALQAAAKVTVWRRDQPCHSVVAGGRVGCLLAGVVRRYCIRSDGHRQILDLLVAGDFLGLVPSSAAFSVEAVSNDTRIASFRPEEIARLVDLHPVISQLLRDRLTAAVRRLEDHLLVQGRITALDKVGGYLMLLRERTPQSGTNRLFLPISRYDIADHLGLAVETVSRAMTTLRRYGVISMASPRELEFQGPAVARDLLT
ncbi:MAG: helix-turn-helix domain-containing protein [Rhizorhabdus sp.]